MTTDGVGVYDFVLCADKTIAAVDNNSQVTMYYKKAAIKVVEERCQYLISSNQVGKVLNADGAHLYFINQQNDGVVRVDTRDFERLRIPFEDKRLFQISVVNGKIYAISEEGFLHCCYSKYEERKSQGKTVLPEEEEALRLQFTLKSVGIRELAEYEAEAGGQAGGSGRRADRPRLRVRGMSWTPWTTSTRRRRRWERRRQGEVELG